MRFNYGGDFDITVGIGMETDMVGVLNGNFLQYSLHSYTLAFSGILTLPLVDGIATPSRKIEKLTILHLSSQ